MVSNNFMEIQIGVGVIELGNPEGMWTQALLKIQVEREGGTMPSIGVGGGGFFLNNPILDRDNFYFASFKKQKITAI